MLRYANVDGCKRLPFPKGRGTCACCGGTLLAKCGRIVTHHWAHESKDDCDSWSEPLGPWHLWWQNLVDENWIEVAKGPHRADIVGNRGVVVELQHSSIGPEDIAAREAYYGEMIWLFDATSRFATSSLNGRSFFSLGRTKHLELCQKPVFLDFGFEVVEVDRFTDDITMVSGYGTVRSRDWFAGKYLSDVLRSSNTVHDQFVPAPNSSDPWSKKSPVRKLKFPTRWFVPNSTEVVTYPEWTEYIKLNHERWLAGDTDKKWHDFALVIDNHPDIANGWTKDEFLQMKDFFSGTAILLGGLLRVLPSPVEELGSNHSVDVTTTVLEQADRHVRAGRLPILKDSTKEAILQRAKERESWLYGDSSKGKRSTAQDGKQRSLFEKQ